MREKAVVFDRYENSKILHYHYSDGDKNTKEDRPRNGLKTTVFPKRQDPITTAHSDPCPWVSLQRKPKTPNAGNASAD
jgi:hypothetical protein